MNLVIVNEHSAAATEQFLTKRLFAIKNQRKAGDTEELALIIDGKTLTWALENDLSKVFLELAIMCKVSRPKLRVGCVYDALFGRLSSAVSNAVRRSHKCNS